MPNPPGRSPPPSIDMSDLTAAWPTMSPSARRRAMRERILGTDRNPYLRLARFLGLSRPAAPPTPHRVAVRALALGLVVSRAALERAAVDGTAAANTGLDAIAGRHVSRITREMEPVERSFLKARVGRADPKVTAAASWRAEGLAVLAWALNRVDLPPYDRTVSADDVLHAIGFGDLPSAEDFIKTVSLRPTVEIDQFAAQATLLTWRFRTYRSYPGPWKFEEMLRKQPSFRGSWLDGLRLIDGDLAIDAQPIADTPEDRIQTCERIALERHIAAYWLQGDDNRYSRIEPSTLLSAC